MIGWAAILFLAVAAAQDAKKPEGVAAVDQNKVDEAVRKGVEWLKGQSGPKHEGGAPNHSNELLLYTFIHAGVPENDPKCKAILEAMLNEPLEKTYKVALQAMILEEIERVRHQVRIWQCGQFLMDNQCTNGQWSYGTPTQFANVPPPAPKPVASGGGVKVFAPVGGPRIKPEVTRKLAVVKARDGGASGDFSNTQYAALGLRACYESGIGFPKDALELAKKAWLEGMHPANPKDGGYGGRGWCYGIKGEHDGHDAYGSMTAGAAGSLAILSHILGGDPKRDAAARQGIEWLGAHFTVEGNVGPPSEGWMNKDPKVMHYYFLYGLERAGILCDTVRMGKHDWYATGATYLLANQKPEGLWEGGSDKVWDTCFAILFLKRATRPLVASQDRK